MLLPYENVNFLAVILAAIVYFALGGLWYSPKLFGDFWKQHDGLHLINQKPSAMHYIGEFVVDLICAYVLAVFIELAAIDNWTDAIVIAFWVWFGFIATTHFSMVIWANKSFKNYLVNVGFNLVGFIFMGIILGLFDYFR